MARVLVTGATGCLGGALVPLLLAEGHQVVAQGRDPVAGKAIERLGAEFVNCDLRAPLPDALLNQVTTVHHCAALSTAWGKAADFAAINIVATRNLLQAARSAGAAHFIFASSPSIYADGSDRLDVKEDAALPGRLATHYARSKYAAEQSVLAADDPHGMRCLALRPRAIYGRGDRSLMPRLIAAIRRGRVPIIDGGRALIDITHVQDAARAMLLAAQAPQAGGLAYNITSGEAWRFTQLLDAVCGLAKASPKRIYLPYQVALLLAGGLELGHHMFAPAREPILTRQAVVSLGRSLTLNIDRARAAFGYQPRITLSEGIGDYAGAF